jgi:S1-C subfamily serine protease
MGIVSQSVTASLASQFGLPMTQGAYLVDLAPGGPAEHAGLKTGDVIVGFDGKAVTDSEQLGNLIHDRQPGDTVTVDYVTSQGQKRSVDVTLGTNPLP